MHPLEQTPALVFARHVKGGFGGPASLPSPTPLPLIVMASDSYLYNLSYVASQKSFS